MSKKVPSKSFLGIRARLAERIRSRLLFDWTARCCDHFAHAVKSSRVCEPRHNALGVEPDLADYAVSSSSDGIAKGSPPRAASESRERRIGIAVVGFYHELEAETDESLSVGPERDSEPPDD